jgi:hypothetical protein
MNVRFGKFPALLAADLSAIASMLVESLADFILSAPEAEQAGMMAEALAHFGHAFLD